MNELSARNNISILPYCNIIHVQLCFIHEYAWVKYFNWVGSGHWPNAGLIDNAESIEYCFVPFFHLLGLHVRVLHTQLKQLRKLTVFFACNSNKKTAMFSYPSLSYHSSEGYYPECQYLREICIISRILWRLQYS